MHEQLISIILPIYNVSEYLEACLCSLERQTYSNFEALLIDDGSTDSCADICRSFCARDSRFLYFYKENGGVADARNFGLDKVSGEYISFVDPDDVVTADYLSYLFKLLSEGKTAVAACNHWICRGSRQEANVQPSEGSIVMPLKEIYERVLYHDTVDVSLWGKLFSRRVFDAVRFQKGKIFEDSDAFAQIMEAGERMAYGYVPQYFYQIRQKSITTAEFDLRKIHYIDAVDHMCDIISAGFPEFEDACVRRRVHANFSTLRFMKGAKSGSAKDEKTKIIKYIKNNGKNVLKNPRAPMTDKIAILSLYLGEGFFHFAWKVFCKLTGRVI